MTRRSFNTSIEGQPLQLGTTPWPLITKRGFNPSIEGQPLQLKVKPTGLWLVSLLRFNPSIEGQPLQLYFDSDCFSCIGKFQSLYRGTAFATHLISK